jgi:hypothetical protein
MRRILTFLGGLVAVLMACSAMAYDITATMLPGATGAAATSCRLYMNDAVVSMSATSPAGVGTTPAVDKPCGVAVTYPDLVTANGTNTFKFSRVNAAGETLLSPATTVTIGTKPDDPTAPPTITVTCDPSPCPANVVITISP